MSRTNETAGVLFVCTGNAGRSQIAQALFARRFGRVLRVESAGVSPWKTLHPMAVKLLLEQGHSTASLFPKHVDTFARQRFTAVVTIGEPARAFLPKPLQEATVRLHWPIADPADADGTPDSEAVFRSAWMAIEHELEGLHRLLVTEAKLSMAVDSNAPTTERHR